MKKTKIVEETKQTGWEVDVRNIKPLERAGGNIREDYGDIDELAASIELYGIKVPIQGFRDKDNDGQWFSIDGHRRIKAAMKLVNEKGLTIRAKVHVVDYRKLSDEQIVVDMVTTNSGKPLNPVELAEAVRRMVAYGNTPNEIAVKFGKPAALVRNLELLAAAPRRLREMIKKNVINYHLVLNILRETKDWNLAEQQIESALRVAKDEKIKKGVLIGYAHDGDDIDAIDDVEVKITRRNVDKATNKINSYIELQRALNDLEANGNVNKNYTHFYNLLVDISKNKLTKQQIIKFLSH